MAGSQDDHTRPFTTRPRLRRGDARESDMIKLKDVYPLYLANEAKQPNTDLEVTDKYTGKVAFRTALADAGTIDAGIAAAVEARSEARREGTEWVSTGRYGGWPTKYTKKRQAKRH